MPDHTFYSAAEYDTDNAGRPLLPNVIHVKWENIPWEKIDVAMLVGIEKVPLITKHNIPWVFHIDQMPEDQNLKRIAEVVHPNQIVLYWSQEEANAWNLGTPVIHPHPIDIQVFKGYEPTIKSAITVATRAFNSWGLRLKGWHILHEAYYQVPIQVIAHGDHEFRNAHGIYTEKEMVEALANHQVYFNCAWKLDRSALEAAAVGMPIVAIRTEKNVYKDIFVDGVNILYANNTKEMIELTRQLLEDQNRCYELGVRARGAIRDYWSPEESRKKWEFAFNKAIEKFH